MLSESVPIRFDRPVHAPDRRRHRARDAVLLDSSQ